MAPLDTPCFNLAIDPLPKVGTGHFAIHVTEAPYPGGHVLHHCVWTESLSQFWQAWQEMFSTRRLPSVPQVSQINPLPPVPDLGVATGSDVSNHQVVGISGRLMQNLGMGLWQWLFDGSVLASLNQSQGIALGKGKPLRLRLEIRDPDLIALPWEIMQDGPGTQAIALSQQLLFSRTTSNVRSLPALRTDHTLNILLVLGQDTDPVNNIIDDSQRTLKLHQEAVALAQVLRISSNSGIGGASPPPCQVDTLVQPTPAELIRALEEGSYNVLFYAGHGEPAPDGGLLFLRPDTTLNGTELAQVLTRCQLKLAVFNACWGAQPDHYDSPPAEGTLGLPRSHAIPRSSLAEVLIHHGVPAVLGMRDTITDNEALCFIQAFAKAIAERLPIDQAVAVARQHLLTLFRFNQQAWTLPVLYMHPEFDGELLKPIGISPTRIPDGAETQLREKETHVACLKSLKTSKVWRIHGGFMRVGRDNRKNDLILEEDEAGVSREHAVIFRRQNSQSSEADSSYFLEDISRFGTWMLQPDGWQKVHRQEVPLSSGTQLKFGSSQNETMEFIVIRNAP